MSKNNNTLMYVGGAGLLALLLLNKKSPSVPNTGSTLLSSAPSAANNYGITPIDPSSPNYYRDFVYPVMLKQNPNVGNPGYRLTDAEAQMYLDNYLDLKQALTNLSQSRRVPLYDVARNHWNENGVPEKRTFLRMSPPSLAPYTGQLENPNAAKGSWLTGALSLATSFIPVVGGQLSSTIAQMGAIGDDDPTVMLNDAEAELIITGGAIVSGLLPLFYTDPEGIALGADKRLTELLEQYTA